MIDGGSNGAWIPVATITFTMLAMLAMVLGPLLGALFVVELSFVSAIVLIGGVIYGLNQYIKYINSVIDNSKASTEQKQTIIATVSILATIGSIFAGFKVAGDFSAAVIGMAITGLTSWFKKLEDLLWNLF